MSESEGNVIPQETKRKDRFGHRQDVRPKVIKKTAELADKLRVVGSAEDVFDTARDLVAREIKIDRARERSTKDKLTGYLNYDGFMRRLEEEGQRAKRNMKPLSVVFFDLNGLKEVNDKQGHEAGNKLIKMAAEIIAEGREYEKAARWGGDEFAKILPETTEEEAMGFWNRVNIKFQEAGISIVAGVAEIDPRSRETMQESWRLCDLSEKEAKARSKQQKGTNIALRPKDLTNNQILAA